MRTQGKITRWNPDKGFGFITPSEGPKQVFVHITAFADRRLAPQVGERVSFELSTDREGRPCAAAVARAGEPVPTLRRGSARRRNPRRAPVSRVTSLIFLIVLAGAFTSWKYVRSQGGIAEALSSRPPAARAPLAAPQFRCDGRTHCSQMSSCEEATWFIRNCPGTQMDGDHDGVPCESQWCAY